MTATGQSLVVATWFSVALSVAPHSCKGTRAYRTADHPVLPGLSSATLSDGDSTNLQDKFTEKWLARLL
jgi:hypothetical protein